MSKRMLNPKVRQILMQGLLVLVFAAAVGLAALVTRHVRMSMRVELGDQRSIGRLVVRMPAKWLSSPAVVEKGDGVEAEEPPSEVQAGRRLRVIRQKSDGLVSPLQHLVRSGHIKGDVIKALAEGREGFSISNLSIGGWPGQMVTTWSSPRAGVVHKDVVACAMLPSSQALVIQLQGLGPLDASDKELVRQMSENVALAMQDPAIAAAAGGVIELLDEIKVEAPAHYVLVPNNDPNQLQRQLLFDGSRGSGWVAVDLTSCVFFADDGEEAFLTMLAGRDPEWRSGPVKHLGLRTLMVDRTEAAGQGFPARGYLTANSDGRALLVVMRGGPGDQRMFDSAWQGIASSVRFAGTRDLSALLVNGAEASRAVAAGEALARLSGGGESGALDWWMWDESENADKELWSQMKWQLTRKGDDVQMSGTRTSRPMAYATDTQFAQQWSASGDLSRYQITTSREVRRAGNSMSRPKLEQQVSVERGRMTLASVLGQSQVDVAAPGRYVPGALLPLVVQELAERPSLVKTESFVGVETLAPPGLLTLFVTRLNDSPVRLDEDDKPMDCVTVSVNGTGMASRWYYSADHELRFIDFAGGLKAQSGVGK